jgi:hypothetical protein
MALLKLLTVFFGNLFLFYEYHTKASFFNFKVQRFQSCLYTINFWTICMLLFALFMENSLFHGTIIVWFLLIPFFVLIIMNNDSHGLNMLLKNYLSAKVGDDISS